MRAAEFAEEEDLLLGAALSARTAALSAAESLGPPDLCYLTKVAERRTNALIGGLLGSSGTSAGATKANAGGVTGFYHHVIGVDISSEAPIASYVADLAATQPSTGWLSGTSWQVRGAVYCCYDMIERQDLRVHISIPGGVRATISRSSR